MHPFRAALISAALLSLCCKHRMDYSSIAEVACCELNDRQAALQQRIRPYRHFDWSQSTEHLVFSSPGLPTLIADVQFVGDLSSKSKTWLWAWANPTVDEPLKAASRRVLQYGRDNGLTRLTTPKWVATEGDAWDATAIAVKVLGAEAAYRTKYSGGLVFMVLDNLHSAPQGYVIDHSGDER